MCPHLKECWWHRPQRALHTSYWQLHWRCKASEFPTVQIDVKKRVLWIEIENLNPSLKLMSNFYPLNPNWLLGILLLAGRALPHRLLSQFHSFACQIFLKFGIYGRFLWAVSRTSWFVEGAFRQMNFRYCHICIIAVI